VLDSPADAVFVGARGWSRRSHEFELDDREIRRTIDYAHDRGKQTRVALNTLPSSAEIPAGLGLVEKYLNWGADGLILTDPGFMATVKKRFPEVMITASVGCSVLNSQEMCFYAEQGADLVVAPCEMTPAEIEQVQKQTNLGIEVLVHANRDFTYLGKCTMSSYFSLGSCTDSRGKNIYPGSPNRGGLCFRVCKTSWQVEDSPPGNGGSSWSAPADWMPENPATGEEINRRLASFRPPTDLGNYAFFLVEQIPDLVRLGVKVFKIQGRVYSVGLVLEMINFYRELLDLSLEDPGAVQLPLWRERARTLSLHRDRERNSRTRELLDMCRQGRFEAGSGVEADGAEI